MTLQSVVLCCDFSSFSIVNKSVTITSFCLFFIVSNDAVLLGLLQFLYIMSAMVKPKKEFKISDSHHSAL
jgi:hypothetical protein